MDWLRRLICKIMPAWTYGLECNICQMSFVSAEAHFAYVIKNNKIAKHAGKIPILK